MEEVIRKIKTSPYWKMLNIKFNNSLVVETKQIVGNVLQDHTEDDKLDIQSLKREFANRVFEKHNKSFLAHRNIELSIKDYQAWMCTDPEDAYNFIEASDYLTAMDRQKELAILLDSRIDLGDGNFLDTLMNKVEAFCEARRNTESSYNCTMEEGLSNTLSRLIPLFLYVHEEGADVKRAMA
jgi:hypothetical protein